MSFEDFRDLAQGVQALLVAFGLVVAGVWAIYRFRSLLSVQKARIDLTKTKAELQASAAELEKIQRDLQRRAGLDLEIEPFILGSSDGAKLYLRARLTMKNSGTHPEVVDWNKSTLKVAEVEDTSNDRPDVGQPIDGLRLNIDFEVSGDVLFPNDTSTEEFLVPIDHHGLYLMEACIHASETSAATVESAGGESLAGDVIVYSAITYVDSRRIASQKHGNGQGARVDADQGK